MMLPEEFEYLKEYEIVLRVSHTVSKETKQQFYKIYNRITGEDRRPNGCGKCFRNVTKLLKHYYENYQKIN